MKTRWLAIVFLWALPSTILAAEPKQATYFNESAFRDALKQQGIKMVVSIGSPEQIPAEDLEETSQATNAAQSSSTVDMKAQGIGLVHMIWLNEGRTAAIFYLEKPLEFTTFGGTLMTGIKRQNPDGTFTIMPSGDHNHDGRFYAPIMMGMMRMPYTVESLGKVFSLSSENVQKVITPPEVKGLQLVPGKSALGDGVGLAIALAASASVFFIARKRRETTTTAAGIRPPKLRPPKPKKEPLILSPIPTPLPPPPLRPEEIEAECLIVVDQIRELHDLLPLDHEGKEIVAHALVQLDRKTGRPKLDRATHLLRNTRRLVWAAWFQADVVEEKGEEVRSESAGPSGELVDVRKYFCIDHLLPKGIRTDCATEAILILLRISGQAYIGERRLKAQGLLGRLALKFDAGVARKTIDDLVHLGVISFGKRHQRGGHGDGGYYLTPNPDTIGGRGGEILKLAFRFRTSQRVRADHHLAS